MLLVITVLFQLALFIGGAYYFGYPVGLGVLYGINVAIMYLVLLTLFNAAVKVFTQELCTVNGELVLSRKQLSSSLPVICPVKLEVPLAAIKSIKLLNTRKGYQLTVQFAENNKTMGVDLDLNPLKISNKHVLEDILHNYPGIETDEDTKKILSEYQSRILPWKSNFLLSFIVLALALIVFFVVSVFLGTIIEY